jgi:hypothetical protein
VAAFAGFVDLVCDRIDDVLHQLFD